MRGKRRLRIGDFFCQGEDDLPCRRVARNDVVVGAEKGKLDALVQADLPEEQEHGTHPVRRQPGHPLVQKEVEGQLRLPIASFQLALSSAFSRVKSIFSRFADDPVL